MSLSTDPSQQQANTQRYFQSDFSGGLRLNIDSTKIEDNEYLFAKNLRNRYGKLSPVKLPLKINNGLDSTGKIQGIYGAGNFLLVFKGGIIYYRNFLDDTGYFQRLSSEFTLDSGVDRIYAELVPSSYNNYVRQSSSVDPSGTLNFSSNIGAPSPQSALVMDGKNQSLVISPQGNIRKSQTFNEWNLDANREYIPIGVMPLYHNGILYMVSPDFKEIYRSVTGRPMDFVIAVQENGDKIIDSTFPIEASRFAHKVDFESITAISKVNSTDGSFLVCTINNSYLATPDQTQTFFGEPGQFNNTFLFSTGAINNFSIADILGDTALIDITGIRSFNAVQQLKFEGKNAPFSNKIAPLLARIQSINDSSFNFDNFTLFSCDTIYGPSIAIYDNLSQSWVGVDQYPGVGRIKQFAQIRTNGIHKLFFYDDNDNVYEAYGSETTAPWQYYREFSTNNPEQEQQILRVNCVLQNVTEAGSVSVTEFSDRLKGKTVSETVEVNTVNKDVIVPPFGDNTIDRVANRTFKYPDSTQGYKTGILVEGNIDLELINIEVIAEGIETSVSLDQQAEIYATKPTS